MKKLLIGLMLLSSMSVFANIENRATKSTISAECQNSICTIYESRFGVDPIVLNESVDIEELFSLHQDTLDKHVKWFNTTENFLDYVVEHNLDTHPVTVLGVLLPGILLVPLTEFFVDAAGTGIFQIMNKVKSKKLQKSILNIIRKDRRTNKLSNKNYDLIREAILAL